MALLMASSRVALASRALMAQFKSVGAVREATPEQLENTPGVGPQLAKSIYEYFHT